MKRKSCLTSSPTLFYDSGILSFEVRLSGAREEFGLDSFPGIACDLCGWQQKLNMGLCN